MPVTVGVGSCPDTGRGQTGSVATRRIIGIAGCPGSGKSTFAAGLVAEQPNSHVLVPMDGFHLPNAVLDTRGTRGVKGAPHTFDATAFVDAIRSIRTSEDAVVLPIFDRSIDEPQAGGVLVAPTEHIVLVEGNYLLLDEAPWSRLQNLFDLTIYVDTDDDVRIGRLIARHVEFGKSPAEATDFVRNSDERNTALVAASRDRADVLVVEA